jgi:hypothetical protein
MEKNFFDAQVIGIPCANCGHKTEHSVGWLKVNSKFACPMCEHIVPVDGREFLASVKSVDDAVFALGRFKKSLVTGTATGAGRKRQASRPAATPGR